MKLADVSNWCHSLSERAVAKLFKNKAKHTSSMAGVSSVAGASDLLAEKSPATGEQTPRSNSSQKTQKNLKTQKTFIPVSYTHLRAHETPEHIVCRLLLEKKKM